MVREASEFSKYVARTLVGAYKMHGLRQADLVERTGITKATMQRILAGDADVDVEQLAKIAKVLDEDPGKLLEQATRLYGGADKLLSEVAGINDLDTRRRQKAAAAMSVEELEAEGKAAIRDPELDEDEPEQP